MIGAFRFWRYVWVTLALVGVGLVAFWAAVTFEPNVTGRADAFRYFAPLAYYFDRSLFAGDFPTWNALTMGGNPFAANPQSHAFYPLYILRGLAVCLFGQPTPSASFISVSVLMGVHLLLLGWGMARLVEAHGGGLAAMMSAAVACTFSAAMVRRTGEFHFLYSLAWGPWLLHYARAVLLRDDETPRRADTWDHALRWGVCLGLAILGGFPQIFIFMMMGMVAYIFALRLLHLPLRDLRRVGRLVKGDVGYGLVTLGVGLGIGAAMLLPAAEFNAMSPRASGSAFNAQGFESDDLSFDYFINCFVSYGCDKWEFVGVKAAGAVALLFALIALLRWRARDTIPLLALVAVMTDISSGDGYVMKGLSLVSPMQLITLSRAFDVAVIGLGALVGLGVQGCVSSGDRSARWRVVTAGLVLGLGSWVLLRLHDIISVPGYWMHELNVTAVLTWTALATVAAAGLPFLIGRWRWSAGLAGMVLPLLLIAEITAWNFTYTDRFLFTRNYERGWVKAQGYTGEEGFPLDNRRTAFKGKWRNYPLFGMEPLINGYDPAYINRARLVILAHQRDRYKRVLRAPHIAAGGPRGALMFKRFFWLARHVVDEKFRRDRELFPVTTTAYVDDAAGLEHMLVKPDAVPRSGLSDQVTAHPLPVDPLAVRRVRKRLEAHTVLALDYDGARHAVVELTLDVPAATHLTVRQRDTTRRRRRHYGPDFRLEKGPQVVQIPLWGVPTGQLELAFSARTEDLVPTIQGAQLKLDDADEDHLIRTVSRTADHVVVEVEAKGPRFLTYLDADYPGWSVTVDAQPATLTRAFRAFKGVKLDPGKHTVRFSFSSPTVHRGVSIALVTGLFAGLALFFLRRRRSRVA